MAYLIKKAKTSKDLDQAMKLRYHCLLESNRTTLPFFTETKRVSDYLDSYPNTINVLAYSGMHASATMRAISYEPAFESKNSQFSFKESFENIKADCYLIDTIAVLSEISHNKTLLISLIKSMLININTNGGRFAFILAPSSLEEDLLSLKFTALSARIEDKVNSSFVTPMVIKISDFYDDYLKIFRDKEIIRFQETFYRILFDKGEPIIREGEAGSTAFVLETGNVEVLKRSDDGLTPVAKLGPGLMIGEIGLVTNQKRTASILALETCSCIAFDREDFLSVMYQHPNRMLDMFQIFSRRLDATTKQLAQAQKK